MLVELDGKQYEAEEFYQDSLSLALCAAQQYAGHDGFVAGMPHLIEWRAKDSNSPFWNKWYTTTTEEHIIPDTTGRFGQKGQPLVLVTHGTGILTPERIEQAQHKGLVFGAAKLTPEECHTFLHSPHTILYEDILHEEFKNHSEPYTLVLSKEQAEAYISGLLSRRAFITSPRVRAWTAGSTDTLERYFTKAQHNDKVGVWYANANKERNDAPRGRVLFLCISSSGLDGNLNLNYYGRFVGVQAPLNSNEVRGTAAEQTSSPNSKYIDDIVFDEEEKSDDNESPLPVVERVDSLGAGGQGEVKKVTYSNGKVVVWKYLNKPAKEHLAIGLKHPNVGEVFGTQEIDGRIVVEREYVAGESLDKLIRKKGSYVVDDAIGIIRQVLDGLAFVHEKGVLHRDVKPSNIIITEYKVAKIIDFGLALLQKGEDIQSCATVPQVVGTFPYMAPEVMFDCKADVRSDLYSVGAVLFHMITGVPHVKLGSEARDILSRSHSSWFCSLLTGYDRIVKYEHFVNDVMKSISGRPASRFQSAIEMKEKLCCSSFFNRYLQSNPGQEQKNEVKWTYDLYSSKSGWSGHRAFLERREQLRDELVAEEFRKQV